MPVFAAFLGSMLTSTVSFLASWFGKQVAIRLALLTLLAGLTAALWAAVTAAMAAISVVVPAVLVIPASWIWPTNANACIGAYIGVRILVWAYHMDLWAMKLRAV